MDTTSFLFHSFPRDVGNPSRWTVKNEKEFNDFVQWNNGVRDCYTAVYNHVRLIDKIFMDFDGIPTSLSVAQKMYEYTTENKMTTIPVVSGRKGIHLYVILKPRYSKKRELYDHTCGLITEVYGNNIPKEVDLHPIGDIKRITRIPNTLRPPNNNSYCTYLPPDEFLVMNWHRLKQHTKSTHDYKYELNGNIELSSLPKGYIRLKNETSIAPPVTSKVTNHELERFLRPCLYRHITSQNPMHKVRAAVTVDLLKLYSTPEVMRLYESLEWVDWDSSLTRKQIESCKNLRTFTCERLVELGIPNKCCEG